VADRAESPHHGRSRPAPDDAKPRPAYYAAGRGAVGDWWTLLHPPYTAWFLAYVVIGASLAPHVHTDRLVATLLAFFGAVGLAAHALDELHGRPLQTTIPSGALVAVAIVGLAGALGLGVIGVVRTGWTLIPFMLVGPVLVVAYNAELFGGIFHTDTGFALSWGAFPVLTAYVAQAQTLAAAPVFAAAAAVALSAAQRTLSTPARMVRRQVAEFQGTMTMEDGSAQTIDRAALIRPLEQALRSISWGVVILAAGLAIDRLG
jgi:hypothetical protein